MSKRAITEDQNKNLSCGNKIAVQAELVSNYKKLSKEQTELIKFLTDENEKLKEENSHLIKHITYGNRDRTIAKRPSRDSMAVSAGPRLQNYLSAGARFQNYYSDFYNSSDPFHENFYTGNTIHPSYGAEEKSFREEKSDSCKNFAKRYEFSNRDGIFNENGRNSRGYKTIKEPNRSTVRAYCLRRRKQRQEI